MLTHGGDLFGFRETYGRAPLDFSVNTNPLGMPEQALEGAARALARAGEYPDPLSRRLRGAIGEHEGVPGEWVLCGNGAADLIWRLSAALRPKNALLLAPTFSEYAAALASVGCKTVRYPLSEASGFAGDKGILASITPDTDVFFLCNPNNPTGLLMDDGLLREVLERCSLCSCLLIADECFMDLTSHGPAHTLKPMLADHKNLVILKAFTKTYAMAGLRLGYCLSSNGPLLDAVRTAGQSWPVSVAAEEAGVAALSADGYLNRTLRLIETERAYMTEALAGLGFRVIPGRANYLLFQTDIPHFGAHLAERGILIRSCASFEGLREGYYRTAIRRREENDQLLSAIRAIQGASQ